MEAVRWVLVLPAAVVTYAVVNIIVAFGHSPWVGPVGDFYAQMLNSILAPAAAVYAGAMVAPRFRFYAGLGVALVHAMVIGGSIAIGYFGTTSVPLWTVLLSGVLGIGSTMAVLVWLRSGDNESMRHNEAV